MAAMESKEAAQAKAARKQPDSTAKKDYHNDTRRRLSYKEKQEYLQLEKEIEQLETEKKQIEEALCSGTLSVEELTEKSIRLPKLENELDEKSMRWLELSEYA